jgi:peptidoglycan L-alanyl-D-glutamate endopeptidase CwlK
VVFKLGTRSLKNLEEVHPDLVKVVKKAIKTTRVDFAVIEGIRTPERQRELFDAGASWTLNSRHLTGHAVDLAAWVGGTVAWDWPLYHSIACHMKDAAKELKIQLEWGGDWSPARMDGPHYQLPWNKYPAKEKKK